MKRKFKLSYLIFFCLIIFSCKEKNEIKPLLEHYNKDNIEFSYNENWILENSEQMNIPILLFKKSNKDKSDFRENINLMVTDKNESIDFNAHIGLNKNSLKLNNFKIIEEGIVNLNDQKAYRVIYNRDFEGEDFTILQYLFLINNTGYTITFTCEQKDFDKDLQEAESIMKTFKFK